MAQSCTKCNRYLNCIFLEIRLKLIFQHEYPVNQFCSTCLNCNRKFLIRRTGFNCIIKNIKCLIYFNTFAMFRRKRTRAEENIYKMGQLTFKQVKLYRYIVHML